MSKLVEPHGGGKLKSLLIPKAERAKELERSKQLKRVPMSTRETSDILMFAMAAYTPLDGFMSEGNGLRSELVYQVIECIHIKLSTDFCKNDQIYG